MRPPALMASTLLLAACAAAQPQPQPQPRFAVASGDGASGCVFVDHQAQDARALPERMQLVVPADGVIAPAVLQARLGARAAALCRDRQQALDQPGTPYEVTLEQPRQGRWHAIANFDGVPPQRLRSCASAEGLHFTAWTGKPLQSRRSWAAYVYLGYDIEPTCDGADFAQSPSGS